MNAGVQLVVLFVFVFVSSLGFQAVNGATHSRVRSSILKQTFMETLSELFHFVLFFFQWCAHPSTSTRLQLVSWVEGTSTGQSTPSNWPVLHC